MKHNGEVIGFVLLALLLLSSVPLAFSSTIVEANPQNLAIVELQSIGSGQTSLVDSPTHTSGVAVKLVIPQGAQVGSGCMVLYPYNGTLNSLQSFQVYTSFTTAVPRFIIYLDTNGDGQKDLALLSDYQFTGNGAWQVTSGGQRWGWTESTPALGAYGTVWNTSSYWKSVYGNATVLSTGVALEYWAVKDSGGLNQPTYIDEVIVNGVTYNIANQSPNPPPNNEAEAATDWPMYRQNLERTGATTSAPNGSLLWRFNTDMPYTGSSSSTADRLRSSPTVANGILYFGGNNSYYYALNATTGAMIWQVDVGSKVESSAAVADGVVYVGLLWDGRNGYVDALNASTGAVIWRFATNSGIESSPAVANGVVYIGSYLGYVYALNAANGALKWSYLTGGSTYSSPAVANGTVYIGSNDGKVYALNDDTGALIWASQLGNPVYASPAVINGTVYVNTDNGNVYALKASDGSKVWQAYIGSGSDHADASPAVAGGVVYVGARNGYYAFNATNGSQIWFFTSPYSPRQLTGYVYSSPAVAGNVVYCGSPDSYLFALNASNANIIWAYRTGGFLFSSPAIANGAVYIGSYDGYIYAFGGQSTASPTPAPTPTIVPKPTATPTPIPSPSPSAPNATSTPAPTTNPSPTPNASAPLGPTQTATKPPAVASESEKTISRLAAVSGNPNSIDWPVLTAIIFTAIVALASLLLLYRKNVDSAENYRP